MRSVIRVSLCTAVLGSIATALLARVGGDVAVVGVIATGVITGLAMAKWLDWSWYGRQFEAGLRAGMIACGLASIAALVTQLLQAPRTLAALMDASHFGPVQLAPAIHALSAAGWGGVIILSVAGGLLVGIALSAGVTSVFALSKNARAVQATAHARQAAQSLRRGNWEHASSPVPAFPNSLSVGAMWQSMTRPPALGAKGPPSGYSAPKRDMSTWEAPAGPGVADPDVTYPVPHIGASAHQDKPLPEPPPVDRLADETKLREAMREALSMWADETEEGTENDQPTLRQKRPANPSSFLNSDDLPPKPAKGKAAAPKRSRRKTDTQDWLC